MDPELEFVIPDIFYDIASELVNRCPAEKLDVLEQNDVAENFIDILTKMILECVKFNPELKVESIDCREVSERLLHALRVEDTDLRETVVSILYSRKMDLVKGIDSSLTAAVLQRYVEDRESIAEPGCLE